VFFSLNNDLNISLKNKKNEGKKDWETAGKGNPSSEQIKISGFFLKRGLKKIRKRGASWGNLEKWVPPAR
jgi:hypothetical protein